MTEKPDKDQVWELASKVPGKDPAEYRQDPYGNEIRYDQYGKETDKGWEVDHIVPRASGGTNKLSNLQVLQTATSRQKADAIMKWRRRVNGNR